MNNPNYIKFTLNGCDISFEAMAPEDITLKQLLAQCDKIHPDWCACGICSSDMSDEYIELKINYDSIEYLQNSPCRIDGVENPFKNDNY